MNIIGTKKTDRRNEQYRKHRGGRLPQRLLTERIESTTAEGRNITNNTENNTLYKMFSTKKKKKSYNLTPNLIRSMLFSSQVFFFFFQLLQHITTNPLVFQGKLHRINLNPLSFNVHLKGGTLNTHSHHMPSSSSCSSWSNQGDDDMGNHQSPDFSHS